MKNSLRQVLATVLLAGLTSAALAGPELPTYDAVYRVQLRNIDAGEALFSMRFERALERYVFESRAEARGLAKLLQPQPAVERSEFLVQGGRIVPLMYTFDDGTRKGKRSTQVIFDWERGIATSSYKGITADIDLAPGILDRMTLQTAVMRDMEGPEKPGTYALVHRNALKHYRYELLETGTTETVLGSLLTKTYLQTREGSSRRLRIWVAPSLKFMPVRMEQERDGKIQTILTLQSLTFHD